MLTSNGNLVAFLVGVGSVRVGEVDVAVGLCHDAADRVAYKELEKIEWKKMSMWSLKEEALIPLASPPFPITWE